MTREELGLWLMGAYVEKQPKTSPINRGVAENFVAGGLRVYDWFTNSREAQEELNESFVADEGPPIDSASREYLKRKLGEL